MKLNEKPFERMLGGLKKYEIRLFDSIRQKISIGDTIVFSKRSSSNEILQVFVENIHLYPDFGTLFDQLYREFPDCDKKKFLNSIYKYYSSEKELEYGFIAFRIRLH